MTDNCISHGQNAFEMWLFWNLFVQICNCHEWIPDQCQCPISGVWASVVELQDHADLLTSVVLCSESVYFFYCCPRDWEWELGSFPLQSIGNQKVLRNENGFAFWDLAHCLFLWFVSQSSFHTPLGAQRWQLSSLAMHIKIQLAYSVNVCNPKQSIREQRKCLCLPKKAVLL